MLYYMCAEYLMFSFSKLGGGRKGEINDKIGQGKKCERIRASLSLFLSEQVFNDYI